jgi:A/G-specific adenine glycosylase
VIRPAVLPPSAGPLPAARARAIAGALVRWFRRGHRDLPWRRSRDPYAVWISEVRLQQTRVGVVVPYYERFLARFPDVATLAAAPLDDVLTGWAGLGYYRRARQLHAAAGAIVRDHAGRLPAGEEELLALPGIGRYTAGAIRSIAYGERASLVDGNVARVLSRLFALPGGPGDGAWEKRLWALATALVPAADPSAFNQGLMELGATVCTPRSPRCGACPLARSCEARAQGRPETFPRAKARAKVVRVERWAWVCARQPDGAILMRRREDDEHNAGQWEVPLSAPDAAGPPDGARHLGAIRHGILARDSRVEAWALPAATARRAAAGAFAGARWCPRGELGRRPVTTITRKVLALLEVRR